MSYTKAGYGRKPVMGDAGNQTVADMQVIADFADETRFLKGTSTQRETFKPYALEGDHWQDTDGLGVEHVFRGGSWDVGLPPLFRATFRRSDGAQIVNSGTTAMKWESIEANTLGLTTGADANGAFVTVPEAGLYAISIDLPVSFSGAAWANLGIGASGATTIEGASSELNIQSGFGRLIVPSHVLFIPLTTTKIWVSLNSNAAGTMRLDGTIRITRRSDIR